MRRRDKALPLGLKVLVSTQGDEWGVEIASDDPRVSSLFSWLTPRAAVGVAGQLLATNKDAGRKQWARALAVAAAIVEAANQAARLEAQRQAKPE